MKPARNIKKIPVYGYWGKLEVGSRKLEGGSWKLGVRSWEMEVGSGKLGDGSEKMEVKAVNFKLCSTAINN